MAGRPKKQGLEFSGWAVDVFEDAKVERLIYNLGAAGFTVYFYLCQRAYAQYGYYLPREEADEVLIARRIGAGVDAVMVRHVIDFCLDEGLFDKAIYETYGVLTSRGIQRGYAVVLPKRRVKSVKGDFWLLPQAESGGAELTE